MSLKSNAPQSTRVLIHAPYGRDGELIQKELEGSGFFAAVCASVEELCLLLPEGAAVALIADEALKPCAVERIAARLAGQPPWSDFPLIIMTSGGASNRDSRYRYRLMEPLGNITLIERPLRPITLVSAVRAALRARDRQYQLREHLARIEESEQALRQSNLELTRANGELEEFAYVTSHDLQEPIRMVNIYTQLILKSLRNADETVMQYAGFVRQGAVRMQALIQDLSIFSRTVHGDNPHAGQADLSVALSEAMSILKNRMDESGATVVSGDLPVVSGDTLQLAHVFQNLLSNSIKYRNAAAPEIHISAERQDGNWLVSFRDNGIGFEQQYAERIFGLFKRLHKDDYPGTGLGLAICKRIVERYGGRIWAVANPGNGATFHFLLPAVDVSPS